MRRFEGLSVGLAEPEVMLFLIESRKHRSSMTGSESNESLTPTTVLYVLQLEMGGGDEEKEGWIFWDHTPTSKTGAINRSHDPAWLTKEDRDTEGVPSAGSSKFSIKVYCHRDQVIV